MAKGYIDFDTFKEKYPSKPRFPKCPRCGKPMKSIMTNIFGKRMCAECFQEELIRTEGARKRREENEAKILKAIEEEEALGE